MSATTPTYCAKWGATPLPVFTKADRIDTARMLSRAVLSTAHPDLAGDIVIPSGIDWSHHKRDPIVDLEHGRHPFVKGAPVASALSSLWEPGGDYGFHIARLNFGDDAKPDWQDAGICTNYFDKSLKVSAQVFALVEQDILPAVSVEFSPRPGFYKAIGYSELEKRPAYKFDVCDGRGWSICAKGVNPYALTAVTKSARAAEQVPRLLDRILRDKRVNVAGTWEPLCEVILKALAPLAPVGTQTVVPVRQKAMNDEYDDTQDMGATADADLDTASETAVTDEDEENGPTPTAEAAYNLAQGATDLCSQIKDMTAKGEHKSGRKKLAALCEKLETISKLAMQVGKEVDADVGTGSDDEEEGDKEGGEKEVTDEDMEPDDDGVLKGIPPTFKKAVKRFTVREIDAAVEQAPAPVVEKAPEIDAADLKALKDQLAALEKQMRFLS